MGFSAGAPASAAIPIGIAVGRQRLQDTTNQATQQQQQLQPKDFNRFNLGLADLGEFFDEKNQAHSSLFFLIHSAHCSTYFLSLIIFCYFNSIIIKKTFSSSRYKKNSRWKNLNSSWKKLKSSILIHSLPSPHFFSIFSQFH